LSDAPRLDHVALAVPRAADALAWLARELGGRPFAAGPGPGFNFWQLAFAGDGVLEVLEPAGPPDGFLQRFLAAHGPGVHHVTFKVPELHAALARLQRFGYEPVGVNEHHPAWKEGFLHPKQAQGIVVQLAESHPELEPEGASLAFPPLPEPAREPARLLGLRLRAPSEAAARRQWQELLGAECARRDGALVFRWPASPLALRVELDAQAPPGPLALELAAPHGSDDGAQPVFGTRWLRVAKW
jgi:methylmalonyl-CoA/ethylmalonyl-CoA epimerase